jgi:uncharacterized membrane protein
MDSVKPFLETAGVAMEAAGVAAIVLGALIATVVFFSRLRSRGATGAYAAYRVGLARSLLLGLELLVAGDIIGTVVVAPSLQNLGVLGGIVVIRTFLSFTLELEVTGRWPWSRKEEGRGGREV